MIGLTMILTIAVCALGFTVIYSALDGVTSDFISRQEDTPTPVQQAAQNSNDAVDTDETENQSDTEGQSESTGDGNAQSAEVAENDAAPPTEPPSDANGSDAEENGDDDEGFDPDFQLQGVTVNLRSGPSRTDDIVTALPPSTPLEYTGEDAPTTSPEDGDRWMRFTTDEGLEGWIREIDVTDYQP